MATNFPTSLDSYTNPDATDKLNSPAHATQHASKNDAIEALEAKVGIDSSATTTSHDYKLSKVTGDATALTSHNTNITPDSAASALDVVQPYNDRGIDIDTEATTAAALYVVGQNTGSDMVVLQNNGAHVSTGKVVNVQQLNASSTQPVLFIENAGDGISLEIDAATKDAANIFTISPAGASPSSFSVTREDSVTGNTCLYMNNHYLWVSSDGKLRISSSRPTSDTNGTVVGAQET